MFKSIVKLSAISCVIASLTGCMATKSFTPEDKKNIHTLAVSKIENPKGVYYMPPGAGLIGVIAIVANKDVPEQLAKEARDNHIVIADMVRDKFISELSRNPNFHLAKSGQHADAVMQITVQFYGFSIPHGFSFDLVPMLDIKAKMLQGNRVVWENGYNVGPLDGLPTHSPKEILTSPSLMRASLQDAVNEGVTGLIAKMK